MTDDADVQFLAGYMSTWPEFSDRHPETLLALAADVFLVMERLNAEDAQTLDRPDIVLSPHPHTLVCPVCGLTRNLPEGWQEMIGSRVLRCTTDGVIMLEESSG